MSMWDVASKSANQSPPTAEYFAKLVSYLDKKSAELANFNLRFETPNETSGTVLATIKKLGGVDARGADFIEYKGRSRSLKLYRNWPICYVLAELAQIVPFTGKRKAWAVRVEHDDFYERWTMTKVGSFLGDQPANIKTFGDFLIEQLLTEELTEDDLLERCKFTE